MFKRVFCLIVLVFTTTVFAQSYTKHTVAKGETIQAIAQKYKVTPFDIYKLNPDSKNGVQPNTVLLIPKSTVKPVVKAAELPKPIVAKALTTTVHTVKPKETLYSIAKLYGISQDDLENSNPILKADGLQPGQELKINKNDSKPIVLEENKPKAKAISLTEYTVKTGETLYSLTHLFNLSEAALLGLNPSLKDGVKDGMILKVPAKSSLSKEVKNSLKNLAQTISNQKKKELVLFLPFNASKIQNDTITTISERLKKDKFLNMTLDFYSGALMAIDSAKVLGINVDVKIFDSQETKNTTNALAVIQENNFANTNAVIGPFYQINVEKVAAALESQNIPVISPLSKDDGKSYKNLFQSMPESDAIKNAMFAYMHQKNSTIIGVIDPKKLAIKQYIQDFQKDVKIVGVSDKGVFVADSIKKYFVKDKMNYVILASEKTGTIFTTTTTMQNAMKDYQVQLVILEPNETLNFEEIALSRLTKLKMAYPSITKDNDTEEAQLFERAFKKKNKIFPNQYAVRGFDITFDTLLRLAQDKTFDETVNETATEQVENKFDYEKKISGGYANNGIYILYYDEDLTIKQAQ